jgi:hypothetical protein
VILEAYSDVHKWCYLGFVPSHRGDNSGANSDGAAGLNLGHTVRAPSSIADANCAIVITPTTGHDICNYAGWCIDVRASSDGLVHPDTTFSGWTVMAPAEAPGTAAPLGADEGGMKAAESTSAYATTTVVPPVPPGSAVEFAVDYAAGTCRVAFYTPEAVSGGFVEAPHAKMELRFVATKEEPYIPARSVPTAEGSGVELYPAVETGYAGTIWRFAAA